MRGRSRAGGSLSWGNGTQIYSPSGHTGIRVTLLTSVRNRGEIAEGWYDPATKAKANTNLHSEPPRGKKRASPDYGADIKTQANKSDSEDDFGPSPPPKTGGGKRVGPVIPRVEDLDYRDGMLCIQS